MDGPPPDRRQQIIDAAFRVFSRKGFKGATNREIAAEAGIAPGLIYWYFRNKEDLFEAVAETKSPALQVIRLSEAMLNAPPREFFRAVAGEVARTFQSDTTRSAARFLLSEGLRYERPRDILLQRAIEPGLTAVARYIERQVERGLLRSVDPWVAARLFLGMIMSQVLIGVLLGLDRPSRLGPLLEEAVEVFLRGVTAEATGVVTEPGTAGAAGAAEAPSAAGAPGMPGTAGAPSAVGAPEVSGTADAPSAAGTPSATRAAGAAGAPSTAGAPGTAGTPCRAEPSRPMGSPRAAQPEGSHPSHGPNGGTT